MQLTLQPFGNEEHMPLMLQAVVPALKLLVKILAARNPDHDLGSNEKYLERKRRMVVDVLCALLGNAANQLDPEKLGAARNFWKGYDFCECFEGIYPFLRLDEKKWVDRKLQELENKADKCPNKSKVEKYITSKKLVVDGILKSTIQVDVEKGRTAIMKLTSALIDGELNTFPNSVRQRIMDLFKAALFHHQWLNFTDWVTFRDSINLFINKHQQTHQVP